MDFEIKTLRSVQGSRESLTIELVTDMSTGKSEIVIEKSFSETFKTSELDKVNKLADRLTGGGGRRCWSLEELANG